MVVLPLVSRHHWLPVAVSLQPASRRGFRRQDVALRTPRLAAQPSLDSNEIAYVARHDFSIQIFEYENEARLVATNLLTDKAEAFIDETEMSKLQNRLPDQQKTVGAASHISYIQAIISRWLERA